MRLRLSSYEKSLDNLFNQVSAIKEIEIKSHLAKYLCIQLSGYLENVVKSLVDEYHNGTCKPATASYISNKMRNFNNINEERLKTLLKNFDKEWEYQFTSTISEEWLSSLESIISQRNLIAHGNAGRSNISFMNVEKYYRDLKELVRVLSGVIHKSN